MITGCGKEAIVHGNYAVRDLVILGLLHKNAFVLAHLLVPILEEDFGESNIPPISGLLEAIHDLVKPRPRSSHLYVDRSSNSSSPYSLTPSQRPYQALTTCATHFHSSGIKIRDRDIDLEHLEIEVTRIR